MHPCSDRPVANARAVWPLLLGQHSWTRLWPLLLTGPQDLTEVLRLAFETEGIGELDDAHATPYAQQQPRDYSG